MDFFNELRWNCKLQYTVFVELKNDLLICVHRNGQTFTVVSHLMGEIAGGATQPSAMSKSSPFLTTAAFM